MCDRHRHLGGNTAKKLDDRPREKAIPKQPERPQLEVVADGQAEVREAVQTAVPRKVDREKIKPQLIGVAEDQMGISSYLSGNLPELIVCKLIGDSAAREDFNWARGIIEEIEENRLSIANKLRTLLSLKIDEKKEKPSDDEILDIVKQLFEYNPQLKIDINFATAWARRHVDGFFSASVASHQVEPVKPAPQRVAHLGGAEAKAGREVSVPKVEVKVEMPVTAKVVDAEVVEAPASGIKLKSEVDLKDMEARLRRKIQGVLSQRRDRGIRLDRGELFSITTRVLPKGSDHAFIEQMCEVAQRIMDEISQPPAPSPVKVLPEAKPKPAEVVPPQKVEPVASPDVVKLVKIPPAKLEDKKTGGFLDKIKALVGIGQKSVAEQVAAQEKPVVVKPTEPVAIPKAQPAVKQENSAVQPEKPATTVAKPAEAPKVQPSPTIQESPEKTDLRNLLTDLRSRESTLRKGERGKDERKAFYRNLAGQLVEKLKIKSTGETAKDRELMKKELLKTFSEQELRSIGPEWLFK